MTFVLMCMCLLAVDAGCEKKPHKDPGEAAQAIVKEYKRGPLVFTVEVDREEMTIADRLRLVLKVRSSEEYEVKLPEFGEHLEQFGVVDYSAPSPRLTGNGEVLYRKSYELEPFLSGDYKIPSMKVLFWKKDEENGKKHEIASEELTITVKSLLPEDATDLSIKEILPPVDLPVSRSWWLYGVLGAGLFLVAGSSAFLLWRKRRVSGEMVPRRPAHEIAYEELESLLEEKLIEKGEVKAFYVRLSGILRHYIENRFGIRAPERTTEEFLAELRFTDLLIPSHKDLLKVFLQHCDMVKFAEHQPKNQEIQKAFEACKHFIAETESSRESDLPANAAEMG